MTGSRAGHGARDAPVVIVVGQRFVPPSCLWCGARLVDREGQPCWDTLYNLTFVCRNGCAPGSIRLGRRREQVLS